MNAKEIIVALLKNGVQLWVEDGKLRHRALKQAILSELQPHIAKHRTEIIALLPPKHKFSALSFAQERLWFLDQLEDGSATYNIPLALRLQGSLNTNLLEKAIAEIIRRHEVLRAVFVTMNDAPIQQIIPVLPFSLPATDLSALDSAGQAEQVKRFIDQNAAQPFNLAEGPLLRASLLKLDHNDHILLFNMHHIVSDGWSLGLLIHELASLYTGFTAGDASNLPPLPELTIQYADFSAWQRNWLQGEVLEKQLAYWKRQLAGAPALLELPTDRPRPALQTFNGRTIEFHLDFQLTQALKTLSRQENATLFMTLYAAFTVLLSRYSRQDDLMIGSPVANRNRAEIEPLIGFFVNTLVLRADLSGNPTFKDLLRQVQRATLDAYAHQDVPFEKLVEELHPERSLSYPPIFQVMFALQNTPISNLAMPGLDISPVAFENSVAKFDLTLDMEETELGLAGLIEYNTDLFDKSTIQHMIGHFQTLLAGIVSNPEERVFNLSLLTEPELQQILVEWNDASVEYPQDKCIHQLFEEQAGKTPDNIAVVFEDQSLTYRELNQRANQLARYLQQIGIGPEVLVGICVERSLEMIVGLFGILKAGGVYLPIDPKYPDERIEFMLQDSNAAILLTQQHLTNKSAGSLQKIILLDADWEQISKESTENLSCTIHGANLAYVIYTSGSTGKPKGVLISHQSLALHCINIRVHYQLNQEDRVLQFASISFDTSLEQILPPLITGARLVIQDGSLWLPAVFYENVSRLGLTVVDLPPAYWHQLTQAWLEELNQPIVKHLRLVIVGGDVMQSDTLALWKQTSMTAARLINAYGPTEATITTTCFDVSANNYLSIGKPLTNTRVYILDAYGQPVPVGAPGELYISGQRLRAVT